ncbi:alpha/beta fold hydrolase [Bacillus solimangrovi]|uniref:Proline iminopeptidase n=1 Tax=Bacillus solimangrovi TaxID=1305675 RepID=A0A1E5LHT1_9BACI|nr:alpha/beta fold hydrolase [Bacillus solimangrovi]OEH93627.1 proline iminopeptidase [Bacillus solimangrovi]
MKPANHYSDGSLIELNCSKFYVNCIGEGEPIVFLHGGPGSDHRFFLPHVLPLADNFKLVLYDQRGCGTSEQSKENNYSMSDEVDNIELLRIQLGFEKMNLFGESWGSMLALLYATTYPERVQNILLTAAIGVTSEGFERFEVELNDRLSADDKCKLSKLEGYMKTGDASIHDIFNVLDPYYVFSKVSLIHKSNTTYNRVVNECIGEDIRKNYDINDKLNRLSNIPILIAQGSHDILTPSIIRELLVKNIPHAQLIEIEECGHWTIVEKPAEMINIAEQFFTTVSSSNID